MISFFISLIISLLRHLGLWLRELFLPLWLEWKINFKTLSGGSRVGLFTKVLGFSQIQWGKKVQLGKHSEIHLGDQAQLTLMDGVRLGSHTVLVAYGSSHLSIGAGTSIHGGTNIIGNVSVGGGCLFARNIFISTETHRFRDVPHLPIRVQDQLVDAAVKKSEKTAISIGDDCWLGWGVVVMPRTTVGKGAILAANSVITKDVAPYSVVGGVPAKELGRRLEFSPKSTLSYENLEDFPYFYSGFYVAGKKILPFQRRVQLALPQTCQTATVSVLCRKNQSVEISIGNKVLLSENGVSGQKEFTLRWQNQEPLPLLTLSFSDKDFEILGVKAT